MWVPQNRWFIMVFVSENPMNTDDEMYCALCPNFQE